MRYPAYKPTGLAWLPEVPREWEMLRLKSCFYERKENNRSSNQMMILSLMKDIGVIPYDEKGDVGNKSKDDISQYKVARKGDLVLNSMNVIIGSVGVTPYDGLISPAYYSLVPRENVLARFYEFMFRLPAVQQAFRGYAKGIMEIRLRISTIDLLGMKFPVPPPAEQEAIVAYLDEKTAKIDRLIELKEREIKLLNEKKQAVISKVVTRESGDAIAVKYLVQINNGFDPTTEGDTPVYGSGAESFKTCGEFKIGPTVLLGRKGATLHIPHYVEGKYWNVDTAFDVKPLTEGLDLRFFYYCATCFDYRRFISQTTLPSMTKSDYGRMKIPRLSLPEQREIVAYLDAEGAKTDKAIAAVTRQIGLLKEYRTRLISDAVTGQIDLRKEDC